MLSIIRSRAWTAKMEDILWTAGQKHSPGQIIFSITMMTCVIWMTGGNACLTPGKIPGINISTWIRVPNP